MNCLCTDMEYCGTILAFGIYLICDRVAGSSVLVKQLYSDLLTGYEPMIRPLLNQSHSISITADLYINNIIEMDTADQKLSFLSHFGFSWRDEFLTWDPEDYGKTYLIRVPQDKIWKPRMLISKPYDGQRTVGDLSDVIGVTSSGDCTWSPEGVHSILCEVNIRYYPFDTQTCTFMLYAPDYTVQGQEMSITVVDSDAMISYRENSQWILRAINATSSIVHGHLLVTSVFTLQRRAEFIMYTFVAPLCLLSFMNVCVFLVPIESGEKGSIAVTIFLSYGVFISTIGAALPQNSLEVSYFLVYMLLLLIFGVLTLAYTILESRISAYAGSQVVRLFRTPDTKIKIRPFVGDANIGNGSGDGTIETNRGDNCDPGLTWDMLLRKLDVFLFVLFLLVLTISTTVFFVSMKRGNDR